MLDIDMPTLKNLNWHHNYSGGTGPGVKLFQRFQCFRRDMYRGQVSRSQPALWSIIPSIPRWDISGETREMKCVPRSAPVRKRQVWRAVSVLDTLLFVMSLKLREREAWMSSITRGSKTLLLLALLYLSDEVSLALDIEVMLWRYLYWGFPNNKMALWKGWRMAFQNMMIEWCLCILNLWRCHRVW